MRLWMAVRSSPNPSHDRYLLPSELRHRLFSLLVVCLTFALAIPSAGAQTLRECSARAKRPNGYFTNRVRVELLDDGRLVKLLNNVKYIDPCGTPWEAPTGSIVNGASVPRLVWSFAGPFEGKYRDASVIHDVACDTKTRSWELVHEAFYYAMRARGTAEWRAKIMYAAVYHFGPRWPDPLTRKDPPSTHLRPEDFDNLKKAIRDRESGTGMVDRPPMSLAEIETWVPPSQE